MTSEPPARSPGLDCQDLVELITDYLEGALGDGDRARFEAHLEICPGCQVYMEQMRATLEVSGRVRDEDVEPEAMDKLLDAFRDWKK